MSAIRLIQVSKTFADPPTQALEGISLEIEAGSFVALTGRSGSGKSTLLYLMSTLDAPTEGTVELEGQDVSRMRLETLHRFRNQRMGFVFQQYYLLPELTALENVLMPARKTNQSKLLRQRALELLSEFGLEQRTDRFPRQLSGGEQQRVVLARALMMLPAFLFADEPTGNLDTVNSRMVMDLLQRVNRQSGTTVVLVTHDPLDAAMAQRQIQLSDGRVVQDVATTTPKRRRKS